MNLPSGVRIVPPGAALIDSATIGALIDLGDSASPPPPKQFVVADLIPADDVTSMFAKGGSSKSFLALIVGFHIVRGQPVFGREVEQGPVLYLDAELDETTTTRRAWMIARGMGLERPPKGLRYLRLRGSLTDERCNAAVLENIRAIQPRLVIIDSFTAALRGRDSNSLDDVTSRLQWLEDFGTVLIIDHTPKGAGIDGSATAIGSVAKQMFARSQLFIASNGSAAILRHEKANHGKLVPPIRFALNFTDEAVTLEAPLAEDDSRLSGIESALPAKDRVRHALHSGEWPDGATPEALAEALDLSVSTVRNQLTVLKRDGIVWSDHGTWKVRP